MARGRGVWVLAVLLGALAGCDKDDGGGKSKSREAESNEKAAPAEPAAPPAPKVEGAWTGRWQSASHKGHGGGLDCVAKQTGPDTWTATFTAEFGRTKAYTIPLEGKRDGDAVRFGSEVDIGKEKGEGKFTWTGKATATEFSGTYEGGGDKGTFSMQRKQEDKAKE